MTKNWISSGKLATKAVGVGLIAGGLMVGLPAAMASAGPLDTAVSNAVKGANSGVQNVVNGHNTALQGATAYYNKGLQDSTAYNNTGLQANVASANSATQSVVSAANGTVVFAVQGLLH